MWENVGHLIFLFFYFCVCGVFTIYIKDYADLLRFLSWAVLQLGISDTVRDQGHRFIEDN